MGMKPLKECVSCTFEPWSWAPFRLTEPGSNEPRSPSFCRGVGGAGGEATSPAQSSLSQGISHQARRGRGRLLLSGPGKRGIAVSRSVLVTGSQGEKKALMFSTCQCLWCEYSQRGRGVNTPSMADCKPPVGCLGSGKRCCHQLLRAWRDSSSAPRLCIWGE